MDYVKPLSIEEAITFIDFAYEKQNDELLYQRWIVGGFQHEMSFFNFKERLKPIKIQSETEILEDVNNIIRMFRGGEKINGNI